MKSPDITRTICVVPSIRILESESMVRRFHTRKRAHMRALKLYEHQEGRGFSPGQGGLAFLGVGAGVLFGTSLAFYQNKLYYRAMQRSETGKAPPEA